MSIVDGIINTNKATTKDTEHAKNIQDAVDDGVILNSETDYYFGLAKVLERSSEYYTVGANADKVSISLTEAETGSCDNRGHINLPISLLKEFKDNNLPDFTVYYHELGHHKYSYKLWKLINNWKSNDTKLMLTGIRVWDEKYFYLLNWIEDFYIEAKMKLNYPYLSNILECLKKLSVTYNELEIEYFFHYLYRYGALQPNFDKVKGQKFLTMWNKLQSLRNTKAFGGKISQFLSKNTNVTVQFIKEFQNLYDFCIHEGILQDVYQPPLQTPAHSNQNNGQGNGQVNNGNNRQGSNGGTSSAHSHKVGKTQQTILTDPKTNSNIFNSQLDLEYKQVENILIQEYIETKPNTLEGLFTAEKELSQQIAEPIIPNFFNQRRLEDRVLFKTPGRTYNNVSIYRDISGSTSGKRHELINVVCKHLIDNLPIDYHYYLYSSGNISIMETSFIDWQDSNITPNEYDQDPIFQQFGGGTNSDAIADVISEQYSDKWLNIIITDGDLCALMDRDNIQPLLDNVAVIIVGNNGKSLSEIPPIHQVNVDNISDIPNIIPMLLSFTNE